MANPQLSPETKRVLLVEGDPAMRRRIVELLGDAGFQTVAMGPADRAARALGRRHFDAVLAPAGRGGRGSLELLREAARLRVPFLALCDPGQVTAGIELLREGAEDYLLRPPDPLELAKRLLRIVERRELDSRIAFFQDELSKKRGFLGVEAHSPAMRAVVERSARVAPMRSTVLITGESGVGKELVARSIHFNSPRREQPFIALNCAAIPASLIESELFGHERGSFTGAHARARGKFEIAHRGTLFLDEIGEMDPSTQVKLLRVLEEREFMRLGGDQNLRVDVRVIAATNADLETLVARRLFRQDLYYRLKVVMIPVPPLRERRADIPRLARTFLEQLSRANAVGPKAISAEALARLQEYHWPGNVRELKNLLESLLVSTTGERIDVVDLPSYVRQESAPAPPAALEAGTTLAGLEREMIRRTLEHTGGNRTHSAAMLGIGVRTLQRKIQGYGLEIPPTRRGKRALAGRESRTA